MGDLQRILAIVEVLLKRSLERLPGRSDLGREFPALAAEVRAAIKNCQAQQIDSLLPRLDHLVTAFSGKKSGPQGFEHFSIELSLHWNELRKLSLMQAITPLIQAGTIRKDFQNLADTLELIRTHLPASLVKKVAESRFLLSQMEHSFSSTSGLRDISKSEETRLVQNFSVLSEKLAYLNQILLSPEGRAVPDLRRLRSSMAEHWNSIIHQVGEVMMRVYLARTGRKVTATSRQGLAGISI